MAQSINLLETVWRENIIDAASVAKSSAELMHDYVQRLQYQRASPVLVAEMMEVRNRFAEICDRLEAVFNYFPKEM